MFTIYLPRYIKLTVIVDKAALSTVTVNLTGTEMSLGHKITNNNKYILIPEPLTARLFMTDIICENNTLYYNTLCKKWINVIKLAPWVKKKKIKCGVYPEWCAIVEHRKTHPKSNTTLCKVSFCFNDVVVHVTISIDNEGTAQIIYNIAREAHLRWYTTRCSYLATKWEIRDCFWI